MLTPISKAIDCLCITGAAYISQSIVFHDSSKFSNIDGLIRSLGLLLPFITFRLTRVYQPFRCDSAFSSVMRAPLAWLFAQVILAALLRFYPSGEFQTQWLLWWTVIGACALIAGRCMVRALPSLLRARQFTPTRVAIVAPSSANGDLLARIVQHTQNVFVPEVIFAPSLSGDTTIDHIPVLREMRAFKQFMQTRKLREIWIVNSSLDPTFVERLLEEFHDSFVNIRMFPMSDGSASTGPLIGDYRGVPVLNVMATPERAWDVLQKEIFDRVFALCVLIGLSPVLLVVAVAVKLSSPGPVLFRQYRMGMNGHPFSIYKFRSMFQGADQPGSVVQACKGDARVTKVGRFLRNTSLDELPQFLNVLKGEMSVVGPRPHAVEHDEYYKKLVQHYMFRYRTKPGVTGWAQINGYRGETAEIKKMEARVKFDLYYIQHWTFWWDMKIIALTIAKGFMGHGAY
ncbi:undecaprenyl-phosphate glucose phosphotransferase [Paraburkholderia diazotrophica]|uniref:undecaprenyl-phosphate glucose phosphotransferase n=1 Tax=Paraburkholderia diazotrophica TaxID=667676 RepID=UPI0031703882